MERISAWRLKGDEWLPPDVLINYGGGFLQLIVEPEDTQTVDWSCCVCGKRLQNVSRLPHLRRGEELQFTPHILFFFLSRSKRKQDRRYCLACWRAPVLEIQQTEESSAPKETGKEGEQTTAAVEVSPQPETPLSLVLKGVCILPVFCIRCGALLPTEEKEKNVFLCPRCEVSLQPSEGLLDVAMYCAVCGEQKPLDFVKYQRKMPTGGMSFTLCWGHAFYYVREYHRARKAKRLALQHALAICMAQGASVEECQTLLNALDRL